MPSLPRSSFGALVLICPEDGVIQAHEFLAWLTAEKPQVVLERTGDGPESFWEADAVAGSVCGDTYMIWTNFAPKSSY